MMSIPSAEAIANNEDLVFEILIRLPPESLIGFKCVSKQWLSLISNPKFIDTHIRRQGTPVPSGLLLNNDYLRTPEFQFVPLKYTDCTRTQPKSPPYLSYLGVPRIKILQSCNGLLLCSSAYLTNDPNFKLKYFDLGITHDFTTSVTESYSGFRYYICNPTTKQFMTLSFPSDEFECMVAINLAFDPSHSPHFKIVCIRNVDDAYSIHIYESQTNTWKPSPIAFDPPSSTDFGTPVFCRRAIHWCSEQQTSLYFNVDTECLNPMPMPPFLWLGDICYFGESRGHLHLIRITTSTTEFDVLELEENYSAWFVRYHVNLDSLRVAFRDRYSIPSNKFFASVLSIVRAEKEEESELVLFVFGLVVSYNFKDRRMKKLVRLLPCQEAAAKELKFASANAFAFVGTLSPI